MNKHPADCYAFTTTGLATFTEPGTADRYHCVAVLARRRNEAV